MTNVTRQKPHERDLRWPLRLTRAGLVAERLTRAFWPLWTLAIASIAALALGFQIWAPLELFWAALIAVPLALLWFTVHGVRAFRWPTAADAEARLDATLPGRPIATLNDQQAIGAADPASRAVWQAHLDRMRARARAAKAPAPDLRLAARDPFALRYAALTALMIALLFGSLWRLAAVTAPAAGAAQIAASWEGWIEPPAYTGRPTLYLSSVKEDRLEVPTGSRIILRLYGPATALTVTQDIANMPPVPATAPGAAPDSLRALDLVATKSGSLSIDGEGGRSWQISVLADAAPAIAPEGPMDRKADGRMVQSFHANDDYAIAKGEVRFALDLAAVPRRYGLAPDPEPQPVLTYDLPLPVSGNRADFTEVLGENASEHPWANLPVVMTMTVTDSAGQTGRSEPVSLTLPGRRFFDPLAAAVIEMRRDLLWSRANARRTDQILRAISHRPEGFVRDEKAYLMLRVAIRRLTAGREEGELGPDLRDELAKALWDVAILIEDGGLDNARERMRRAQERLSEAIKNGASQDEIQKLMDELRAATDDYLNMLAERQEEDPADRFTQDQPGQNITDDQIQQMMDEIQRLMEEGKMAEAQELLNELNQLLENLKVTQGEGGEGRQRPGQQAMRELQDTLRNQQQLSDDAFREGQQNQDGREGQGDPQGLRDGEEGPDQKADPSTGGGEDGQSLADRQRALRRELDRQRRGLPDAQGQDADNARRSLEEAGRAMDGAEEALRNNDLPTAIDRQAEAIENLREGMRSLGQAYAQDQNRLQGAEGQAQGDQSREVPLDPLGRQDGARGQLGDGRDVLQDKDVYRRARDLLDEIRRRSSDQTRPAPELDYLKRLLDQF